MPALATPLLCAPQVVVELEANIKGSLPKPEYELVEVDVEVRRVGGLVEA